MTIRSDNMNMYVQSIYEAHVHVTMIDKDFMYVKVHKYICNGEQNGAIAIIRETIFC